MHQNIYKISESICSINSNIDINIYKEKLNILYGMIFEITESNPLIISEIIEIENLLINTDSSYASYFIDNFITLLLEYSKIAYHLALNSLYTNKIYIIANYLEIIFMEVIKKLTDFEKNDYKNIISETILDFRYAMGDSSISSLRIGRIIEANKQGEL